MTYATLFSMTPWIALVPFILMFGCFALLKMNLLHSSFVALLACTLFSQTVFKATPEMWQGSLQGTGIFLFEIGLILVGAFFFIEIAKRTQILDSLAQLIQDITPNRIAQAILVTFPLEFMIEGSSGFGTPILMVAPLLRALGFPLLLCATLPFIGMITAIPFGALGTPIRLGFVSNVDSISQHTSLLVIPFLPLAATATAMLVYRLDPKARSQLTRGSTGPADVENHDKISISRLSLWIFLTLSVYATAQALLSRFGPEFPALGGAFFTFLFVLATRKFFLGTRPLQSLWGIQVYGLLLFLFWIGKQIWLDERIPGTPLRWFNPGWVFLLVGTGLIFLKKLEAREILSHTWIRSRRTLMVFFCMTWTVQQLQVTGAMQALSAVIPEWMLHQGAPVTGWLGSILIGTSTLSNLFLSPLFAAALHPALAAGSAMGVQLAFQSISGVKSILEDQVSERAILQILAPLSLGFVLALSFAITL